MSTIIQHLQTHQLVRQARQLADHFAQTIPSGFSGLDQKLNGGWPDKGIIELQTNHIGIGEIRLLLPILNHLQATEKLYIWVAPPGQLNGQALAVSGLPVEQNLVVSNVNDSEAFWVAEKSLRSGCCAALVLWCQQITPNQAKRLQLAAKEGQSIGFIIRPSETVQESLPISVRMQLSAHPQGLQVDIHKRLGGHPSSPFSLDLSQHWPQLTSQPMTNHLEIVDQVASRHLSTDLPENVTALHHYAAAHNNNNHHKGSPK